MKKLIGMMRLDSSVNREFAILDGETQGQIVEEIGGTATTPNDTLLFFIETVEKKAAPKAGAA